MSILNPKDDANAIEPVLDKAIAEETADLVNRVAPALSEALKDALDALTITITVSKKKV